MAASRCASAEALRTSEVASNPLRCIYLSQNRSSSDIDIVGSSLASVREAGAAMNTTPSLSDDMASLAALGADSLGAQWT